MEKNKDMKQQSSYSVTPQFQFPFYPSIIVRKVTTSLIQQDKWEKQCPLKYKVKGNMVGYELYRLGRLNSSLFYRSMTKVFP
jgi:hypothetical protein